MDNVKFEHDELIAAKNIPLECNVTVTPLSMEEHFTLTLFISGEDVFFVTPTGTSQKSVRTFKSNGFAQPRLCEMELLISSEKPGTTVTILDASTKTSNKPEIKLTLHEEAAEVDAAIVAATEDTDSNETNIDTSTSNP